MFCTYTLHNPLTNDGDFNPDNSELKPRMIRLHTAQPDRQAQDTKAETQKYSLDNNPWFHLSAIHFVNAMNEEETNWQGQHADGHCYDGDISVQLLAVQSIHVEQQQRWDDYSDSRRHNFQVADAERQALQSWITGIRRHAYNIWCGWWYFWNLTKCDREDVQFRSINRSA